jgi:hypothetical protein
MSEETKNRITFLLWANDQAQNTYCCYTSPQNQASDQLLTELFEVEDDE